MPVKTSGSAELALSGTESDLPEGPGDLGRHLGLREVNARPRLADDPHGHRLAHVIRRLIGARDEQGTLVVQAPPGEPAERLAPEAGIERVGLAGDAGQAAPTPGRVGGEDHRMPTRRTAAPPRPRRACHRRKSSDRPPARRPPAWRAGRSRSPGAWAADPQAGAVGAVARQLEDRVLLAEVGQLEREGLLDAIGLGVGEDDRQGLGKRGRAEPVGAERVVAAQDQDGVVLLVEPGQECAVFGFAEVAGLHVAEDHHVEVLQTVGVEEAVARLRVGELGVGARGRPTRG